MKNFLIITNYYKDSEARLTNRIKEYIEKKGGSCSTFFSNGETPGEAAPHREDIPENTQGVLVLGGDGTLIRAAAALVKSRLPLIGVNLGTLGYLCELEEKDVFAEQVRTVTLYAFDDNNNLVYQNTDEGEPWAGLNDESFAVPLLYPNQSKIEELTVKTLRKQATRSASEDEKDQYIVENSLYSLWHGEVKKGPTTRSGRQQITNVSLVKNTNTIHVIVAQVNQSNGPITKALTEETFQCAIYDDNGYMNYDNSLLEDNLLTYKPYNTKAEIVTTKAFSADNEPAKEYNGITSDLSVARLVKGQTPELTIRNSQTQEVLFHSDDLIKYFEEVDAEKYKDRNYSLQEYLDREDEYTIKIFVDEKLALIKTVIDVNDWIIQINDIEL